MTSDIKNFFDKNKDVECKEISEEIKLINDYLRDIQRKINRYDNLVAYGEHSRNEKLVSEINRLLHESNEYSDLTPEAAYNSFANSYSSRIFEIAIFSLLKHTHGLNLLKRPPNPPDFIFATESDTHHVECISRTSSQMDEYFKLLPKFKYYIQVIDILIEKNNKMRQKQGFHDDIFTMPRINLDYLSDEAKQQIKQLLKEDDLKEIEEKINFWVYIMRYAYCWFDNCISDTVIEEFLRIRMPKFFCRDAHHIDMHKKFILCAIKKAIEDKIKKVYSKDINKPLTLAISISLGRDALLYPDPKQIKELLCFNLKNLLNDNNLSNLYAIIIDTSWYNFFPDIAVENGAKFPDGFNNCYICLYNKNHDLVKNNTLLYEKIPFQGFF